MLLYATAGRRSVGKSTQVSCQPVGIVPARPGLKHSCVQVPKAPMPEARFRVAAVQVPSVDENVAVAVLGGHHRCNVATRVDADPNDDGRCDEIAHAAMFLDSPTPPLFLYTPA